MLRDHILINTTTNPIPSSDQDWKHRLQKAILILDYIEEMDSMTPEPITMCDINFNQFGIADNMVKYSNLSHIHSAYFIDRYLSDAKECWRDRHCSYKECKTKCGLDKKCTNRQLNNNLQIVCNKVRERFS